MSRQEKLGYGGKDVRGKEDQDEMSYAMVGEELTSLLMSHGHFWGVLLPPSDHIARVEK